MANANESNDGGTKLPPPRKDRRSGISVPPSAGGPFLILGGIVAVVSLLILGARPDAQTRQLDESMVGLGDLMTPLASAGLFFAGGFILIGIIVMTMSDRTSGRSKIAGPANSATQSTLAPNGSGIAPPTVVPPGAASPSTSPTAGPSSTRAAAIMQMIQGAILIAWATVDGFEPPFSFPVTRYGIDRPALFVVGLALIVSARMCMQSRDGSCFVVILVQGYFLLQCLNLLVDLRQDFAADAHLTRQTITGAVFFGVGLFLAVSGRREAIRTSAGAGKVS